MPALPSYLLPIRETIKKHTLFEKGDRILVAISGGPDSVFLAFALRELGYDIGLAHVNYQLRGADSDADADLVKAYADKWKVPLFMRNVRTNELAEDNKASVQMIAREARYEFFLELMEQEGFDFCATAHHADDQTETLLINFLKGDFAVSPKAIPVKRGMFVRPLLELRKTDILDALEAAGLAYRIDASNLKNDYLRNNIRNRLIPLLNEINPSIQDQLSNRYDWEQMRTRFHNSILDPIFVACCKKDDDQLDWGPFVERYGMEQLPLFLDYALRKWGLHGYEIRLVLALVDSQPGRFVETGIGKIIRSRNGFTHVPINIADVEEPLVFDSLESLANAAQLRWNRTTIGFSLINRPDSLRAAQGIYFLDPQKLNFPLVIRNWQTADKMMPLGMHTYKKLSDIFTDEKVDLRAKQEAVIIEDQKGIVCLSGFRISDKVKVEPATKTILKITIQHA